MYTFELNELVKLILLKRNAQINTYYVTELCAIGL